jgi:hypothetical protein
VENLQQLHQRGGSPRRRASLALAVLASVFLWIAVLGLLAALLS